VLETLNHFKSVIVDGWSSTPHAHFASAHWLDLTSGEPLSGSGGRW